MKYLLPNNYRVNLSPLMIKLAISAGMAGTFVLGSQPVQAINELPESKATGLALAKVALPQALVSSYQASFSISNASKPVLIAQSLNLTDSVRLEKSRQTKVSKQISTIVKTLQEDNDLAQTKIVIQSNLNTDNIQEIPELPALGVVPNPSPQKPPKQIHIVRSGETLTSIALKYDISDQELIAANNISNPDLIEIDDQLILPVDPAEIENQSQNALNSDNSNSVIESSPVADTSLFPLNLADNQRSLNDSLESTSSSNNNNNLDPYINKLRADIVQLRTQYQTQVAEDIVESSPITTELTPNSEFDDFLVTSSVNSNSNQNSLSPEKSVSIAPNADDYNEILELSSANVTIPDLPPLSSPEEYLPSSSFSNSNSFNGYIWPAQGTFTSGYGWRWGRMHKGIDIAAPIGTPILAAASGEVISAGWNSGGYGNLVKVKHSNGSVTLYAHNNRIYVRRGQKVKQGQQIAEMGSTGFSTGPHLHFEIRKNGNVAVNPIAYLSKRR